MDLAELKVFLRDPQEGVGQLQAWNVNTREVEWTHEFGKTMNWGSVLTTAGGIVFNAGTNDRMLRAFDAESGEVLWEFPLNSAAISPPVSYEVDGKQYIAITAGYGVDAQWTNSVLADADETGEWNGDVPVGGAIWVFALPDA